MAQQAHNDSPSIELDPSSPAHSRPMTTSNSGGVDAPINDATGEASSSSSPYGTRSRNRSGNSRPNYAEDKDMDFEMDHQPGKKDTESKKLTRQNHSSAAEAQRPTGSSRRSAADDNRTATSHQHGAKDENSTSQVPSTQAGNGSGGSQPASKKRKAAAQSGNSTPTSQANQAGATSSKRSASQPQSQNQRSALAESNMLTFTECDAMPKDGKLVADDGTVLAANDHVYLVCEPPGEPYYIGRIMEFLYVGNDPAKSVDALRINWFYRPKDIGRRVQDTRLLVATMHSDITPLTALRGKCEIRHRSEIKNLDEYRRTPDCFWYEKLYDRYIQKNYDLIPTSSIINVPDRVKRVLDERWKFVLVEQGRGKELTSAMKLCKKCGAYCASNDSVDCSDCKLTYHMNCVSPPVTKKPSRGFGWSCAACSRKHEQKLHARNTPSILNNLELDDDEFNDDLHDELNDEEEVVETTQSNTPARDVVEESQIEVTPWQLRQASLWPYRYLGQHCKVEDALDYDDRIYPRASSRLGPRHQAGVLAWPGQPVEYEPVVEFKRTKKDSKLSKEIQAAIEAQKIRRETRPKWIQDEPPGYIVRGEDHDENDPESTSTLLWKPPSFDTLSDDALKEYSEKARAMAPTIGVPEHSTSLQNIALTTLYHNDFDTTKSLETLSKTDVEVFKEPNFTAAEQKKFEEAVIKHGSELHSVTKHMKTRSHGDIVRYYYIWKKTDRGKQIWGDYSGRKGKKEAKKAEEAALKLQEDLADDRDDSAYDNEKALEKKKSFICKFCSTKSSRQWRRAPASAGTESTGKSSAKDKKEQHVVALCRRCAELWRRYGIQWEDLEEMAKKVAQAGGRAWKRKQDEELLKELIAAKDLPSLSPPAPESRASQNGTPVGTTAQNGEPPRKKLKGTSEDRGGQDSSQPASKRKEKAAEKLASTPPVVVPELRTLPCAICGQLEPLGDQHLSCRECRLAVHRNCYGVVGQRALTKPEKWTCDTCANDRSPQVSIDYKCVLCPVEHTIHDFVGLPKSTSHKKKSDKDRERERLEREQAQMVADLYRKKQEESNRPVNPREALKRTADNNWVHVTCAVWTPEIKFASGEALVPAEGIASIPRSRFNDTCTVCDKHIGACVSCLHCRAPVHVECARQSGYVLGFDITPIKGSRRDQFNIVTINGESGAMLAAIWCKEHVPTKTIVHSMNEIVDENGLNALQLYVQNFKQADKSMTDTVRKANMVTAAARSLSGSASAGARRHSTTATIATNGTSTQRHYNEVVGVDNDQSPGIRICITCGIDVSPKWWCVDDDQSRESADGYHNRLGSEAQKFVEQRRSQCHKCHKTNRKPKPLRASPTSPLPPPPEQALPMAMPGHHAPSPTPAAASLVSLTGSPQTRLPERPTEYHPFSWPDRPPPHHHHHPPPGAPINAPHGQPHGQPHQLPHQHPPQHPSPHALPHPAPHSQAHQPQQGAHLGHHAGPSPMPSMRQYPTGVPFNDWHGRSSTQHGSPGRQMNGEHPLQPSPMTGLSSLRPSPLSAPPAPPPPLAPGPQGNHLGHLNGLPPSPRRSGGPPIAPPSSYGHPYHPHHPHGAMPHGLPNGTPPHPPPTSLPPRGPDHMSHGLLHQRPPYGQLYDSPPPHGNVPMSREGPPLARDSTPSHHGPPAPRPPETRPASGASASPSLRNLLL